MLRTPYLLWFVVAIPCFLLTHHGSIHAILFFMTAAVPKCTLRFLLVFAVELLGVCDRAIINTALLQAAHLGTNLGAVRGGNEDSGGVHKRRQGIIAIDWTLSCAWMRGKRQKTGSGEQLAVEEAGGIKLIS